MTEYLEVHFPVTIPRLLREGVEFETPDDVWSLMTEGEKNDCNAICFGVGENELETALKGKINNKKELMEIIARMNCADFDWKKERDTYQILVAVFEKNGEQTTYLGSRFC